MIEFKHVLVPTDFGDAAVRALDFGTSLAKTFHARLTLLHAYTLPLTGTVDGEDTIRVEDVCRTERANLDAAVRGARALLPDAQGLLTLGDPWREILRTAEVEGADLIVMGTHGRRGVARAFLGSVAEKVVRHSPVPVLVVSKRETEQLERPPV